MHLAEIGHFRAALDLGGGKLADRREHGRHRDVDPGVDRAELGLRPIRRRFHGIGIGDIGRHCDRADAVAADQALCDVVETILVAAQQRKTPPVAGELLGYGATDACTGAGNNGYSGHVRFLKSVQ